MTARERLLWNKYGLTLTDYDILLANQNGVCFLCGNPPKTRSLHVDHEHVKGFKKFPPEQKRKFVRGLLCFRCNHRFMSKGMTFHIACLIASYLYSYEKTKNSYG